MTIWSFLPGGTDSSDFEDRASEKTVCVNRLSVYHRSNSKVDTESELLQCLLLHRGVLIEFKPSGVNTPVLSDYLPPTPFLDRISPWDGTPGFR